MDANVQTLHSGVFGGGAAVTRGGICERGELIRNRFSCLIYRTIITKKVFVTS
jgi:hypothetical protein